MYANKNEIINGDNMTVAELIKKLEELGYNEDTEIVFGFYGYGGEWYDFQVEEIEDNDREVDVDVIGVNLEFNKNYEKLIMEKINADFKEDLLILIQRYC